ncbi:MAG: hypothetical protein ACM3Q2_02660 [Syntrophothermus sp.]
MKALFSFLLIFSFSLYSQITNDSSSTYKLANITAVTPAGEYDAPRWSPDGSKILFTKQSTTGLYVLELKTRQITKLNNIRGAGYNATWSNDSKSIYFRDRISEKSGKNKYQTRTSSIDVTTGETASHPEIDIFSIPSRAKAKSGNDIVVYYDTFTIKASTLDKSKEWIIAKTEEKYGAYYGLVLSPDKKKILIHQNGEMLIYATDGSGLIRSLGRAGIADCWTSDGKQILSHISKDDGHEITGSDLYLINSDGTHKYQLTNTPDIFENEPDLSPDNKQVVFSDLNTGIIYIADFIKNYKGD